MLEYKVITLDHARREAARFAKRVGRGWTLEWDTRDDGTPHNFHITNGTPPGIPLNVCTPKGLSVVLDKYM